jgi:hypothetical protein
MAHRNPDRVTLGDSVELPTATSSTASRHCFSPWDSLRRNHSPHAPQAAIRRHTTQYGVSLEMFHQE